MISGYSDQKISNKRDHNKRKPLYYGRQLLVHIFNLSEQVVDHL